MAAGVTVTVLGKSPPSPAVCAPRRENHSKYSSLNFSSHDEIVLMRLVAGSRHAGCAAASTGPGNEAIAKLRLPYHSITCERVAEVAAAAAQRRACLRPRK